MRSTAEIFEIGMLGSREGVECILDLAAIAASVRGSDEKYQRPVTFPQDLRLPRLSSRDTPRAIPIFLLVIKWFFRQVYWTNWISVLNYRKRELLKSEGQRCSAPR
jgi:hypothetical protein